MLIIYHQGTEIFLTGRSLFSAKRVFCDPHVICMWFTPKMKLIPSSGPNTTKSKDTGGMCMDNVHKKFGEKIGSLVCIWGFILWGRSVHSYIGGYVREDVVNYIVTPCYLYYVHTFLSELTHLIDWFVSIDGSAVLNW